ncbi:MAG: maleylpyruvate isomerase family mycothiol-dependent enzyme [Acidimicrobiales bacterium]
MPEASDHHRGLTWSWVADERRAFADVVDGLAPAQWDEPSLCGRWRVRGVVAHLVWVAEYSRRRMYRDVVTHPFSRPNRFNDRMAVRLAGAASPTELLDRLRASADGRFVVPLMPPAVALGEVLTHRADVTRPLGLPARPADERLAAVLDAYRRLWFAFGVPRRVRTLRLAPTDAGWQVGPEGGPEVRGPGESLLLGLAGRRVALADLEGPGVETLR